MNTRYPRIRQAYAGTALVRALDRIDGFARSADASSLVQLVLVQYLDVLESALVSESETVGAPGSLLQRALEAVQQALDAFGLLEAEPKPLLH